VGGLRLLGLCALGLGGNTQGQGADMALSGAKNVDGVDEGVRVVEVPPSLFQGPFHGAGGGTRECGCLEDAQLPHIHPLSQMHGVVHGAIREAVVYQPRPRKGMAGDDDDQRVDSRLLEAGGAQDCQIEAGAQPVLQDAGW